MSTVRDNSSGCFNASKRAVSMNTYRPFACDPKNVLNQFYKIPCLMGLKNFYLHITAGGGFLPEFSRAGRPAAHRRW